MQVQDDDKPYDDINITPMLDLAYVLLIIFIIMTTASVQGIKVDLPKASSSASLAKPKTKAITVADSVERYKSTITTRAGQIHRVEDWGRRQLAYMIEKLAKAHYVCMNIECDQATLDELEHAFKFNDAVLRHLIVKMKKAETGPSPMMKEVQREEAKKAAAAQPAEAQA